MRDFANLLPWLAEAPGEPEPDPLAEAEARGRAEAETVFKHRLAAVKIEERAGGRLHNAADALAYIDPSTLDAEDTARIDGAISALLERKPHLGPPVPPEIENGDDWLRVGFGVVRRDPRMGRLTAT